jgi:hypothetical protein
MRERIAEGYNFLRVNKRIESTHPDSELVIEAIRSKLDPLGLTKDDPVDVMKEATKKMAEEVIKKKAMDALIKRHFSRFAAVLEWLGHAAEVADVFFTESEVASDYHELSFKNGELQRQIATRLSPFLKPEWESLMKKAVMPDTGCAMLQPPENVLNTVR